MITEELIQKEEKERIQELYRYNILDTEDEKDYDDLVKLAASICETPIAMISLIDQKRQWFKARTGLEIRETPRNISFCSHAIQYENGMIVKDASQDQRFQDNPFVNGPANLKFYASVPLTSSRGYKIGTLCVIDRKAKELSEKQLTALRTLSNQVMKLMDLRLSIQDLKALRLQSLQSETRFSSLAKRAPIGIYQTDIHGKGIYVNQKWVEITNISEEEVLTKGWMASVHSIDRPKVFKAWAKAVNTHTDFNFEFRFQNSKKGLGWLKSQASPIFTDSGQLSGYVGTLEDITDQRLAEQTLKESELKYRLISTNSKDVIVLMTNEKIPVHLFVSSSAKEVFGYEPEELIGHSPFEIIHPDDLRKIQEEIHPASVAGRSQVDQNRVIKKDGTIIYTEFVSGPAYDDNGKEIGIMATIRDITEQKLAEFKLEESERLYRLISANSNDLLAIFEANEKAKCIYVSPSCKEILGYAPQELIGLSPFAMIPRDEGTELKISALPRLIKGESVRTEFQMQRRDGTFIWVETLAQPIFDANGKISSFQASARDISERKKFERQLKAEKEKAEESTLTKSQFLSTMSHEIRTPMNAIIGLTNLLLQDSPRKDQEESLQLLRFSGENLLTLINDILDLNKIEAGKMELENIAFDIKNTIQKNINLLRGRAIAKDIELYLSLPDDLPPFVLGDPTRLGQVLNNLIGNAVKFTEKGSVTVTIKVIERTVGSYVLRFVISDTGIGIQPEKLDSIFENFTQASSDTTRKYGGTGLGLSISKKLLTMMGGNIDVQSEFGKGTQFSFDISFASSSKKHIETIQKEISAAKMTRAIHVLLVEDNAINQVVASNFLKKWGITCTIACDGNEAIEIVKKKAFDLVLMDLQMPGMDGYQATQCIRAMDDPYFQELPILALSASAMLQEKEKAMANGFSDFVTKPFQPQELKEKIFGFVQSTLSVSK